MERKVKQVIVMRKDLNMRKGKMIAQGAHAAIGVLLKIMRGGVEHSEYIVPEDDYTLVLNVKKNTAMHRWISHQFKKVAVSVNSEEDLLAVYDKAVKNGLPVALIKDAGHTEFNGVPTFTCLAIGPAFDEEFVSITDTLSLL